jgi:hypothetical protein
MTWRPRAAGLHHVPVPIACVRRLVLSRLRPRQPRTRSADTQPCRHSSARSAPFLKDARLQESSGTPRRRSRGTNAASPPASAPAPATARVGMGRRSSLDLSVVVRQSARDREPGRASELLPVEQADGTTPGAYALHMSPGADRLALFPERTEHQPGGDFGRRCSPPSDTPVLALPNRNGASIAWRPSARVEFRLVACKTCDDVQTVPEPFVGRSWRRRR